MNGKNRIIEAMAAEFSKQMEADYKEFKEIHPNGKEPEFIIFIDKKYAPEEDIQEA
jgi:hypothetical protein